MADDLTCNKKLREILGKNIRTLRRARNISQEKLAEMADLSTVYLGRIENGRQEPSLNTIGRIANALGVESIKLFTDDPASSNSSEERVRKGIRFLFNQFVRDELEKIGDEKT